MLCCVRENEGALCINSRSLSNSRLLNCHAMAQHMAGTPIAREQAQEKNVILTFPYREMEKSHSCSVTFNGVYHF